MYPYNNSYLQQTYQQPYQPTGIIWVSGDQEAQMYPIAANNAVALWGRDGKTVYLKSADMTGKPTMKVYDLTERVERPVGAFSDEQGKVINYATKDDLARVVGMIKAVEDKLEGKNE